MMGSQARATHWPVHGAGRWKSRDVAHVDGHAQYRTPNPTQSNSARGLFFTLYSCPVPSPSLVPCIPQQTFALRLKRLRGTGMLLDDVAQALAALTRNCTTFIVLNTLRRDHYQARVVRAVGSGSCKSESHHRRYYCYTSCGPQPNCYPFASRLFHRFLQSHFKKSLDVPTHLLRYAVMFTMTGGLPDFEDLTE